MPLLLEGNFDKAQANVEKHGVTFDEASTVFKDLLSVTIPTRSIPRMKGDSSCLGTHIVIDF